MVGINQRKKWQLVSQVDETACAQRQWRESNYLLVFTSLGQGPVLTHHWDLWDLSGMPQYS